MRREYGTKRAAVADCHGTLSDLRPGTGAHLNLVAVLTYAAILGRGVDRTSGRDADVWKLLTAFTLTLSAVAALPGPAEAGGDPPSEPPAIVPLAPRRLLETRSGEFNRTYDRQFEGIGRLPADSVVKLKVRNRAAVAFDASAALLNVTAIAHGDPGYVTVYPCGGKRPLASHVNYAPGEVVPNAVLTKIGTGGNICVYTLAPIDLVVDVNGYVPYGGAVEPIVPMRVLDSRPDQATVDGEAAGIGRRPGGQVTELLVRGRGGAAVDADAVFLNVTAVDPGAAGFLTVYPCGEPRPLASNVNYAAGQTVPNAVVTKVGPGGKVCIFTLAQTHLVVDLNGFLPAGTAIDTLVPARLLETRVAPGLETIDGRFQGGGQANWGTTIVLDVAGRGGVSADAEFALLNVTAVGPTSPGFLTVFPCDENRPLASNVNYAGGDVRPNFVLAKLSDAGTVCIFTSARSDIVVDVAGLGSYTPSAIEQLRRDLTDGNQTVFGRPRLGIFACLVPPGSTGYDSTDRIRLDLDAIAADANRIVSPYFETVSGGSFVPEFVAMWAVALGADDDNSDCLRQAGENDLEIDLGIGVDNVPAAARGALGLARITTQGDFRWSRGVWLSGKNISDDLWHTWTHEIGHTLFWKHSNSHDGFAYGDHWDIMGWSRACRIASKPFGDICAAGQQTQAMNRFASGWLDEDLVKVHTSGSHSYDVGPLGGGSTELVVATTLASASQALTIETRVRTGYDEIIDAEGVVVRFSDGMRRRAAVAAETPNSCNRYPPTCDRVLDVGGSVTVDGVTVEVLDRTGADFTVKVSGVYSGRAL